MGGSLNPVFRIQLNGIDAVTLKSDKNAYEKTLPVDKIVELKPNMAITVQADDPHSFEKSNHIGSATIEHVVETGAPFTALNLDTKDGLMSMTITLVPVPK